jgi:hypothetical protein
VVNVRSEDLFSRHLCERGASKRLDRVSGLEDCLGSERLLNGDRLKLGDRCDIT